MSSVIIVPECLQDSHQIQDLTIKHSSTQQKQQQQGEHQCPQCGVTSNQSSIRLVHDTCGHLKCRLCLLKEENGCLSCEQERIKIYSAAQQRFSSSKRSPVIEERAPVLVATSHEPKPPTYVPAVRPEPSPCFSQIQSPPPPSYHGLQRVKSLSPQSSPARAAEEQDFATSKREVVPACEGEVAPVCERRDVQDPLSTDMRSPASESSTEVAVSPARPPVINKKKRNRVLMYEHIVIVPAPTGSQPHYKCNICQKSFKTRNHVRYHEFCASGSKPYQCEQCEQSFITKSHYDYHTRTHQGIRPFVCKECGKSFGQKGKLTRHLTLHTGEKKFVCEQCGKAFNNGYALNNHKLVHTGEKPHACSQCGRRFAELSNLKKHVVTHTNFKPYMCEECGKAFSLPWALNLHRKTHTRERDFVCQECSKPFTNKRDLKRHSLIHSDLRPHSCPLCNVAIRRKDNLERHMRNTHPELSGNADSDPGYITLPHEPHRANAVPVINSAPPAALQSQLALDDPQPLALDTHHSQPLALDQPQQPLALDTHHGYTTRNLHPENSPHLFIASKNINPV